MFSTKLQGTLTSKCPSLPPERWNSVSIHFDLSPSSCKTAVGKPPLQLKWDCILEIDEIRPKFSFCDTSVQSGKQKGDKYIYQGNNQLEWNFCSYIPKTQYFATSTDLREGISVLTSDDPKP